MSIGDVIANERRRRLISVQLVVLMKCKTIETVHKGQNLFFYFRADTSLHLLLLRSYMPKVYSYLEV